MSEAQNQVKAYEEKLRRNLKSLVESYIDIQKLRIAYSNRLRDLRCLECGRIFVPAENKKTKKCPDCGSTKVESPLSEEVRIFIAEQVEELKAMENKISAKFEKYLKEIPDWTEWLVYVRGAGKTNAGKLFAWINWDKVQHPSSLWRYFGLHTVAGRAAKCRRGEKGFDKEKKAFVLEVLGSSLLRGKGGYYKLYNKFREEEKQKRFVVIEARELDKEYHSGFIYKGLARERGNSYTVLADPEDLAGKVLKKEDVEYIAEELRNQRIVLEKTNVHQHRNALRKMVKVFLSHLTQVHFWLEDRIFDPHYAIAYKGENWGWLPVLDTYKTPDWWIALRDEYRRNKLRPVVI